MIKHPLIFDHERKDIYVARLDLKKKKIIITVNSDWLDKDLSLALMHINLFITIIRYCLQLDQNAH